MQTPRSSQLRASIVVVTAVIASRVAYHVAGVEFNMHPLDTYLQMLDPHLLETDLLRSIYYTHIQPPAFNLYVGLVLKAFGREPAVFHILAVVGGCIGAVALQRTLERLGVGTVVAATVAIVFFVSPWVVLPESMLFYDAPLMVILCVASLFLLRFTENWRLADGLVFFALLALAALMRSMFHPIYLLAVIVLLLVLRRDRWRAVLGAAWVPVALVLALYVKNLIVFGGFFGSSWMGADLFNATVQRVPLAERRALVADGTLSPAALLPGPWVPLDTFRAHGLGDLLPPPVGVPVLDDELKSTGEPNMNNPGYVAVDRLLERDALVCIRRHPADYAMSMLRSYVVFCYPVSHVWMFGRARSRVAFLDAVYDHALLGTIYNDNAIDAGVASGSASSTIRNVLAAGLVLMVGIPILVLLWMVRIRRAMRSTRTPEPITVAAAIMVLTVVFVTLTSSAFSGAENSRYRLAVDPFLIALVAGLIVDWRRRRGHGHNSTTPPVASDSIAANVATVVSTSDSKDIGIAPPERIASTVAFTSSACPF